MTMSFHKSRTGGRLLPVEYEMAPSITIANSIPLKFGLDGKLTPISAIADRPDAVSLADKTSTANGGEQALVGDIGFTESEWKCFITPLLNGVVAQAGGSTSTIIVLGDAAYSANDWRGGQVYIKEWNLLAIISASSACSGAGQPMTFTITSAYQPTDATISGEPFNNLPKGALLPAAPDGKTIYATPLGRQVTAAKFHTGFQTISQLIADRTGGYFKVMGVNLAQWRNPYVVAVVTT